ncbi:hypothetical protein FOZ62_028151 [Perkinsus olseni]|uniref:Uncharacterized protein n=1 Tax=Perkinsus olseni TaxID=32597 RepID=A0A7J6STL3_PEROL|nr:hypothetical protein FOZ62_028151 [Perkinsus olseni]
MPSASKRARSRAGRTRGKARYRAKQRRLSSATSTKGDRSQPASYSIARNPNSCYWDSVSPSPDWQEIADRTVNLPHKEVPPVDGSGLPAPEQWNPSAYNFEMAPDPETTRLLSDCVFEAARSWACKPEVLKFLQSFQRADEKKRMELQSQNHAGATRQQAKKEKTPDWREIPDDLRFESPTALQYDIQGADRLLNTGQTEQKWLVGSDWGSVEAIWVIQINQMGLAVWAIQLLSGVRQV